MYKIRLTIENPMTGEARVITKQFDPDTMTQTKWNNAYPSVKAEMDALKVESLPNEPATW